MYETTITNKLVNKLYEDIQISNLPVRIFQSKNERVNGDDLEIILPIAKDKYIRFFCQAKRIEFSNSNPNGYYKLSRFTNGNEQIVKLLDYARNQNGFPIYLFYNYTEDDFKLNKCVKGNKEFYGCSITSAHFLASKYLKKEKMITAKFKELHPPSMPLIVLSEMVGTNFLKPLGSKFGKITNLTKYPLELVHYSENELRMIGSWREIFPSIHQGDERKTGFENDLIPLRTSMYNLSGFNPAFRIIFTTYPIEKRYIRKS